MKTIVYTYRLRSYAVTPLSTASRNVRNGSAGHSREVPLPFRVKAKARIFAPQVPRAPSRRGVMLIPRPRPRPPPPSGLLLPAYRPAPRQGFFCASPGARPCPVLRPSPCCGQPAPGILACPAGTSPSASAMAGTRPFARHLAGLPSWAWPFDLKHCGGLDPGPSQGPKNARNLFRW